MNAPEVSILMAAYNAERYLGEALSSALEQTGIALELIAVDDGSTDRTPGILDACARRDPRLRVLHRANRGCLPSRNEAFAQARGRYLMLRDADDRLRPGKLAKRALVFTFLGRRAFHRCARAYRRLRARINHAQRLVRDPPWAIGNQ